MQPPEFDSQLDLGAAPKPDDIDTVPTGNGVFLFRDNAERPLMLGVAANLRAMVRSKLFEDAEDPLDKKRVKLTGVARSVAWLRTVNEFERYLCYWQIARVLYPKTYRKLLPFAGCWFVTVDPQATYPRFEARKSIESDRQAIFGPLLRRKDAEHLIRLLEDGFDLCRYYDVLLQTPHGQACAYFDMRRCPAPCDGSVPMATYHASVNAALAFLKKDANGLVSIDARMKEAAATTNFELAGVYKKVRDELNGVFAKPAFRHVRYLNDTAWIAILLDNARQRHPDKASLRAYGFWRGTVRRLASGKATELETLTEEWRMAMIDLREKAPFAPDALAISTALLARYLFKPDQRMVAICTVKELGDSDRLRDVCSAILFNKP